MRKLPLRQSQFFLLSFQTNERKKDCFVVAAENAARNFSEELLEDGRDRVDGEAVNVYQPTLLQEVDQLVHVALEGNRLKLF